MQQESIVLDRVGVLQHLASIYRNQRSGILDLRQDHCLRKLLFRDGLCITAMSTLAEELPGYFLFMQNVLDQQHFDIYLEKSSQPDMRQWELATENLNMSNTQLRDWKAKYVLFVVQQIFRTPSHTVAFENKTFSQATAVLCDGPSLIKQSIDCFNQHELYSIQPLLEQSDAIITTTEKFPLQSNDKTVVGLRSIIGQSNQFNTITSNSLLTLEEIQRHLLWFSLLGWVKISNQDQFIQTSHIAMLSPQQKTMRQTIMDFHALTLDTDYYHWFDIDDEAPLALVEKQYKYLQSTLLHQDNDDLFHASEENLTQNLRKKIDQAYQTLIHTDARQKYAAQLQKPLTQSFAADPVIAKFKQYQQQKQHKQALQVAYKHLQKDPDSVALSILFVEGALTSGEIQNPSYQKKSFELVKHHIQQNPHRYEPLFLLGKLCLFLQQRDHAIKAFTRALETRPDLPSLRSYILEKSPDNGREIILLAIAAKFESMTYYQLLAVNPNASRKDIHDAYRLCCRYFHPDHFYNQKGQQLHEISTRVFKEMASAYRILRNINTRKTYDNSLLSPDGSHQVIDPTAPPKHFKAKEYYALALDDIKQKNLEGALVNLRFALQFEPDNILLQEKITWVQTQKKAH
ncbi:MAG: DnaJ domain-containing protein [Bdellovibrionota bacterium]